MNNKLHLPEYKRPISGETRLRNAKYDLLAATDAEHHVYPDGEGPVTKVEGWIKVYLKRRKGRPDPGDEIGIENATKAVFKEVIKASESLGGVDQDEIIKVVADVAECAEWFWTGNMSDYANKLQEKANSQDTGQAQAA